MILTSSVQKLTQQIQIFGYFKLAFGLLALIFLALTVFLVIHFKIWQVLRQQSGAEQRKSVRNQQLLNAQTGRLNKTNAAKLAAQEFDTAELQDRRHKRAAKASAAGKTGGFGKTGSFGKTGNAAIQAAAPAVDAGEGETSVLSAVNPVPQPAQASKTQPVQQQSGYRFVLLQDEHVTHTNERIPEV